MSQPRQKRSFIGLLPQVEVILHPLRGEGHFITLLRPKRAGPPAPCVPPSAPARTAQGERQRRFNADRLGVV